LYCNSGRAFCAAGGNAFQGPAAWRLGLLWSVAGSGSGSVSGVAVSGVGGHDEGADGAGRPQLWVDPEVARLEAELARLADALAASEAELVEARVRLDRFTLAHDRLLAPLYAELDAVEARIAELSVRAGDLEDEAAARRAWDRARQSAAAAEDVDEAAGAADDDLEPGSGPVSDEVRRVFRRLARRCHPDLAEDGADRQVREEFMRRVNEAFRRADLGALRRLEEEWLGLAGVIAPEPGRAGRADRLRAAVAATRRRLAETQAELAALVASPMGCLLFASGHERHPRDVLEDLAAEVRARIRRRRAVPPTAARPWARGYAWPPVCSGPSPPPPTGTRSCSPTAATTTRPSTSCTLPYARPPGLSSAMSVASAETGASRRRSRSPTPYSARWTWSPPLTICPQPSRTWSASR
jgi:hypothetical protein